VKLPQGTLTLEDTTVLEACQLVVPGVQLENLDSDREETGLGTLVLPNIQRFRKEQRELFPAVHEDG
jgi:hypothetical protein